MPGAPADAPLRSASTRDRLGQHAGDAQRGRARAAAARRWRRPWARRRASARPGSGAAHGQAAAHRRAGRPARARSATVARPRRPTTHRRLPAFRGQPLDKQRALPGRARYQHAARHRVPRCVGGPGLRAGQGRSSGSLMQAELLAPARGIMAAPAVAAGSNTRYDDRLIDERSHASHSGSRTCWRSTTTRRCASWCATT